MNDMQRKTLIAVAVVVLGMLLYPPYQGAGYSSSLTGYSWLFSLPYKATVDVATLLTQWVGVLIVGGIAFLTLKSK